VKTDGLNQAWPKTRSFVKHLVRQAMNFQSIAVMPAAVPLTKTLTEPLQCRPAEVTRMPHAIFEDFAVFQMNFEFMTMNQLQLVEISQVALQAQLQALQLAAPTEQAMPARKV
jgi:hypothetical protein